MVIILKNFNVLALSLVPFSSFPLIINFPFSFPSIISFSFSFPWFLVSVLAFFNHSFSFSHHHTSPSSLMCAVNLASPWCLHQSPCMESLLYHFNYHRTTLHDFNTRSLSLHPTSFDFAIINLSVNNFYVFYYSLGLLLKRGLWVFNFAICSWNLHILLFDSQICNFWIWLLVFLNR